MRSAPRRSSRGWRRRRWRRLPRARLEAGEELFGGAEAGEALCLVLKGGVGVAEWLASGAVDFPAPKP